MSDKSYKIILTKIKSNHSSLRTDVVEGHTFAYPTKGMPFVMFSKSLTDPDKTRVISTTQVEKVWAMEDTPASIVYFSTKNSDYKVQILEWPSLT
jgi:hypothetical protein